MQKLKRAIMKKFYLIILLTLTLTSFKAQTFSWAKLEGLWAYDYGLGITTDNSGNVYVAGKYEMNAVFTGNTLTCAGNHDLYLAKYSPTGSLTWIRTGGGTMGDYAHATACDGNNIFIAGEIEGSNELISFPGSAITLTSLGDNDIMLAKYDLNGTLLWAKSAGGYGGEKALGVSYDAAGNVYICGDYEDTCKFSAGTTLYCSGVRDIFVAKYDANGNFVWARKAGGSGRDEALAIKCDATGNCYVTGMFSDNCMFGSTNYTTTSPGFLDGFLAKYDTNGNLVWMKPVGGSYDEVGWSVTMDNAGMIYISGEFNATGNFGTTQIYTNGNADAFVAKYDAAGNVVWAKGAGGPLIDRARGIGTDGTNVFITGQFGSTANFGTNVVAADSSDIFFASLSSGGTFMNALSVGGTPDAVESLGYESGVAITGDASGNVYATGGILDGGIFGTTTLSKWDRTDAFVTKITQFVGITTTNTGNKTLRIYPSPGNGDLLLEWDQLGNTKTELLVYNSLGQVIRKIGKTMPKMNVDLSDENDGIYFIEIRSEEKTIAAKKVIVQK
jgi:hypothetical protein